MIVLVTYLTCIGLSVGQPVYCPVSGSSGEPPYTFTPDGLGSVLFANIASDSETSRRIDSVCHTHFKAVYSEHFYVTYLSIVFEDSTNQVLTFLSHANNTATYFLSPQCSFQSRLFASGPGQTDLFYRSFISPSCKSELSVDVFVVSGLSPIYGGLPQSYVFELVNIIGQSGFGSRDFIRLPMSLPPRCVRSQPCTVNNTNCDGGLYQPNQPVYNNPISCGSCALSY